VLAAALEVEKWIVLGRYVVWSDERWADETREMEKRKDGEKERVWLETCLF
jgi:hypothetical protein